MNSGDELVNLRCHKAGSPVWAEIETGRMVKLAPTQAVRSDYFRSLAPHERARLVAIATGRGVPKSIAIGRTAARIHGMWVVTRSKETAELTRGAHPCTTMPEGQRCRRMKLRPEEITLIDGARTLTPFRTAADIAATYGLVEGLVAMSWLKYSGWGIGRLRREAERLGPVKGIATIRQCIELSSPRALSPFEPYAQGLFVEAGIEGIRMHPRLPLPGGRYIEPDLMIGDHVAVEIDGDAKYDGVTYGSLDDISRGELKRQKLLINMGLEVVRFSPRELLTNPEYCIETLRGAIERASRRPSQPGK